MKGKMIFEVLRVYPAGDRSYVYECWKDHRLYYVRSGRVSDCDRDRRTFIWARRDKRGDLVRCADPK